MENGIGQVGVGQVDEFCAGDIPARLTKVFNSRLNYCTKGTPSKG
jgi:hypothetical protein